MTTRNASRGLAAAALTGGLTFGLGVAAPAANAMPATDGAQSVGALCQAGREASTTATPTTSTGLPGLHCGQMFGQAAAVSLSRVHASAHDSAESTDETTDETTEETTDDSDEVTGPDSTDTDRSTQSADESDSEDASGGHNSPAEDSHEHADLPDEAGSHD